MPPKLPKNFKSTDVDDAITRLQDSTELTPADVRPIAILYKDLYRETILNPEDDEARNLWKRLNRVVAVVRGRDDEILIRFLQKIQRIKPARTIEELERHKKEIEDLKDSDIPASAQVQAERVAKRARRAQEREMERLERERIKRGEPADPKDIPVAVESVVINPAQPDPGPRAGRGGGRR